MAATLSNVQVGGALVATLTSSTGSSTTATTINHATANTPVVGAGAGQVNKIYDAQLAIVAAGTPQSLDLTSGLFDPQGNALVFTKVNQIKISNLSVTPGEDITPFGGTNGLMATGTAKLLAGPTPGSITYDFGTTGITVDGTHKILLLTSAAGSNVPVKVTVIGQG
jgi:hypothetical protein